MNQALENGTNAWLGVRMDNGSNGCVEAVTKIGSYYSDFLTNEYNNGVVNVDQLIADAENNGVDVIPFNTDDLEEGDIIVYGEREHVVIYDGEGGYVGNSSSREMVVHGADYTCMGMEPTEIIKTSEY